jgi:hypothetical protein
VEASVRRQLLIVGSAAVAGTALIALAQAYRGEFEAWVREDVRSRVRIITGVLTVFTSGPSLAMAIYCWLQAKQRGAVLRVVAVFSGAAGVVLAILLWRLLFLLEQSTSR